jgi:hypothetical protein
MIKFFRKYHKWLGVIFALIILSYVFSGIILNHREALSFIDVNRKILPKEYRFQNWNNAAAKSTLKITPDSILVYGNIGIWLTDSSFSDFTNFSSRIPKGIDNRKVFQMIKTTGNSLVAGTFSGLYTLRTEIKGKLVSVTKQLFWYDNKPDKCIGTTTEKDGNAIYQNNSNSSDPFSLHTLYGDKDNHPGT